MSLVELVKASALKQMGDIADRICEDYKREVQRNLKFPNDSTGEAVGSIHVEQMGDLSYRIGSNHKHLYFFEEGNGPGRIYPKHGKALAFPGNGQYKGRGNGKDGKWILASVSPYAGKHCNRTVAARYR